MSTLLIVDGHSQAYRAYFGVKNALTTRSGEPTAAVYGFIRKLLSVLREYKPEFVAVAFDAGDTWRHAEFAAYKATRDAMPDDMRIQLARIEQVLKAFNIPVITYSNYEADDILGTLAERAADQGTDVLILTGDRDMFQLVGDHVKILYTRGGPSPETVLYGPDEVQERYGLRPEQIIDLKALTGDSSDNIPGVVGVGEKTAIKFLAEYATVDNLYAHVDEVSGPKTRQRLIEAAEQVRLNRRSVTISTNLDIPFDPEACRLRNYNREAVLRLFDELEFRSLVHELPEAVPAGDQARSGQMTLLFSDDRLESGSDALAAANNYRPIQSEADLQYLVTALSTAERISFDVETTSTNAMQAKLVGLGIAWDVGQTAYVPVSHAEGAQLAWEHVCAQLQPFFAESCDPQTCP